MMRRISTDPPSASSSVTVCATNRITTPLDRPNGLPPLFATLDAILHRDVQRVLKYLPGFLEAHTVMLALI